MYKIALFIGSIMTLLLPTQTLADSVKTPITSYPTLRTHFIGEDWGLTSYSAEADVNGDDIADIVVSARSYTGATVSITYGGSNILSKSRSTKQADVTMTITDESWDFITIDALQDINNDGYDDLALNVGSEIYIIYGRASFPATMTLPSEADAVITGVESSSMTHGDYNADGITDLIISNATSDSDGGTSYLILGENATNPITGTVALVESADASITGTDSELLVRNPLTLDMNGDAIADLLYQLTVYTDDTVSSQYNLFYGGTDFLDDWAIALPDAELLLSEGSILSANSIEDINGDGSDDFAFTWSDSIYAQQLSILYGQLTESAWTGEVDLLTSSVETIVNPDVLGWGGPFAEDINNDGISDLLVQTSRNHYKLYDAPGTTRTTKDVRVYFGAANFDQTTYELSDYDALFFNFGGDLSTYGNAADITGDGQNDLILSYEDNLHVITSRDSDEDGYTGLTGDCNDRSAKWNPAAPDRKVNIHDNDCNGIADDGHTFSYADDGAVKAIRKVKGVAYHDIYYASGNRQRIYMYNTFGSNTVRPYVRKILSDGKTIAVFNGFSVQLINGYTFVQIDVEYATQLGGKYGSMTVVQNSVTDTETIVMAHKVKQKRKTKIQVFTTNNRTLTKTDSLTVAGVDRTHSWETSGDQMRLLIGDKLSYTFQLNSANTLEQL